MTAVQALGGGVGFGAGRADSLGLSVVAPTAEVWDQVAVQTGRAGFSLGAGAATGYALMFQPRYRELLLGICGSQPTFYDLYAVGAKWLLPPDTRVSLVVVAKGSVYSCYEDPAVSVLLGDCLVYQMLAGFAKGCRVSRYATARFLASGLCCGQGLPVGAAVHSKGHCYAALFDPAEVSGAVSLLGADPLLQEVAELFARARAASIDQLRGLLLVAKGLRWHVYVVPSADGDFGFGPVLLALEDLAAGALTSYVSPGVVLGADGFSEPASEPSVAASVSSRSSAGRSGFADGGRPAQAVSFTVSSASPSGAEARWTYVLPPGGLEAARSFPGRPFRSSFGAGAAGRSLLASVGVAVARASSVGFFLMCFDQSVKQDVLRVWPALAGRVYTSHEAQHLGAVLCGPRDGVRGGVPEAWGDVSAVEAERAGVPSRLLASALAVGAEPAAVEFARPSFCVGLCVDAVAERLPPETARRVMSSTDPPCRLASGGRSLCERVSVVDGVAFVSGCARRVEVSRSVGCSGCGSLMAAAVGAGGLRQDLLVPTHCVECMPAEVTVRYEQVMPGWPRDVPAGRLMGYCYSGLPTFRAGNPKCLGPWPTVACLLDNGFDLAFGVYATPREGVCRVLCPVVYTVLAKYRGGEVVSEFGVSVDVESLARRSVRMG